MQAMPSERPSLEMPNLTGASSSQAITLNSRSF
jgi:hypothetical protein